MLKILLVISIQVLVYGTPMSQPTHEQIKENWMNLIDPHETECICASGVNSADVHELWLKWNYPANKHCLKCYLKCVYDKIGVMDGEGNVRKDVYQKLVLGTTDEIYDTCEFETCEVKDICLKIYNFDKCIAREMNITGLSGASVDAVVTDNGEQLICSIAFVELMVITVILHPMDREYINAYVLAPSN
ncbi:hypothetical protein FQA39_LY05222 [Lamprigera yunnana]|nr:hypothetical protein FQA39_LY05222 [Lamprigera yunnana]